MIQIKKQSVTQNAECCFRTAIASDVPRSTQRSLHTIFYIHSAFSVGLCFTLTVNSLSFHQQRDGIRYSVIVVSLTFNNHMSPGHSPRKFKDRASDRARATNTTQESQHLNNNGSFRPATYIVLGSEGIQRAVRSHLDSWYRRFSMILSEKITSLRLCHGL